MTIKNHEFMFDAISKVRQVTEQRNAIKEALLSERGFTDERQLSLEKRRLLETKVDEVIARRGGNSDRQKGVISEAKEKRADKDYDKDGKIETSKAEVMGSRMRAAKKAGKLKGDDKTPPFTPDKKPVVRGTGGPGASAKWLAQQAKRRMMAKEEVEQMDEAKWRNEKLKGKTFMNPRPVNRAPKDRSEYYGGDPGPGELRGDEKIPLNRKGKPELSTDPLADRAKLPKRTRGGQKFPRVGPLKQAIMNKEEVEQQMDEGNKENKKKKNEYVSNIIKKKLSPEVLPSLKYGRRELKKEEVEQQMDEGAFKQREIKKQDAERERLRGTWEGGKQPYTPPKGDPRVDKTALRAREYYKKHGKMPPDLA